MKKKIAIILAMILAISAFALTACGGKDDPKAPASDGSSTEAEAPASDDSNTEADEEEDESTILGEEYAFGDNTVFVPEDWAFSDEGWEEGKGTVTITYSEETYVEISSMGVGYNNFDDMYAYYNEDVDEADLDIIGKLGKNTYLVSQSYEDIAKDTVDWLAKMFVSKGKNFTIELYNNCPEEDEDKLFEDIKVIFASVK